MMRRSGIAVAFVLLAWVAAALAQVPVTPVPSGVSGTPAILGVNGTAQSLFARGEVTRSCAIINPSTAADQNIGASEEIWVDFTGVAAVAASGGTSIPIPAGQAIACPGPLTTSVSWIAATAPHRITAYHW
jgi:hypothetical protein